jgi:hypothetical protein|tara:strand:+ start:45282 stop:45437 length:156 start_codon:yes stop_codon:yes gene_type:complete
MIELVERVKLSVQRNNPRASLTEVWRLLDELVARVQQLEHDAENDRYLIGL